MTPRKLALSPRNSCVGQSLRLTWACRHFRSGEHTHILTHAYIYVTYALGLRSASLPKRIPRDGGVSACVLEGVCVIGVGMSYVCLGVGVVGGGGRMLMQCSKGPQRARPPQERHPLIGLREPTGTHNSYAFPVMVEWAKQINFFFHSVFLLVTPKILRSTPSSRTSG